VEIEADRKRVERCLNELGLCFCFAPLLHPAMKYVGQVRRKLGVPTLFNYLGPLCNPANASFQVIGTGRGDLQTKLAATLVQLPVEAAIVVRGLDGMDEVTLSAETSVYHVQYGMTTQFMWEPKSFGLETINAEDLAVSGPEESAARIRSILQGELGPSRDIVLANAAAGLWVSGKTHSLFEGVELARRAIDRGEALGVLTQLAKLTHEQTTT
jgi:anthranilate phosphoribosyltransferase